MSQISAERSKRLSEEKTEEDNTEKKSKKNGLSTCEETELRRRDNGSGRKNVSRSQTSPHTPASFIQRAKCPTWLGMSWSS